MSGGARDRAGGEGELNAWWRLGRVVVMALARLLFRLRFLDVDRIPERGPAIIACSHVSVLDGPVLALPPAVERGREIRFLVAAELFRSPAVGWILRAFDQIPIRRGSGDSAALDEAIRTIHDGAIAGVFPEGTVNPDPSELQRVRTGAARIALAAGAPLVPAGIWGTHRRWPRAGPRFTRPWRPTLVIAFGEAIDPQGDPDSREDAARLTARLSRAIAAQVERAREAARD